MSEPEARAREVRPGATSPETARAPTLRIRRERALLSQEELAERAGLSVRTVRNIEAQRLVRPHPETVRRISAALSAAGAPPTDVDAEPGPDHGVHQLPPAIPDFTGRDAEVTQLCSLLRCEPTAGTCRVLSVAGLGGVGKTALAVHVAHLVRERFRDGQLYVDLRGAGPSPRRPGEVLAQFLLALGVTDVPDGVEERAALYRSTLDGKRVLVLLDNVADEAQVRPLLVGGGCAHLVTSRNQLLGLEGGLHRRPRRALRGGVGGVAGAHRRSRPRHGRARGRTHRFGLWRAPAGDPDRGVSAGGPAALGSGGTRRPARRRA